MTTVLLVLVVPALIVVVAAAVAMLPSVSVGAATGIMLGSLVLALATAAVGQRRAQSARVRRL